MIVDVAQPVTNSAFKNLFVYAMKQRFLVVSSLLLIALTSLATAVGPRLIGRIIDDGILKHDNKAFITLIFLYSLTEACRLLCAAGHTFLFSLAGQRVMQDIRVNLYKHFLKLPPSYFDKNPSGQIVTRITNDISVVGQLFTAGVINVLEEIFTVAVILIGLTTLNLQLALYALAPFPLLLLVGIFASRWVHKLYRRLYATLESFNTFLSETLLGIKVIQLHGAEAQQMQEFEKVNIALGDSQYWSRMPFAVLHPLVTFSTAVSVASLIWFGGSLVISHQVSVGILVAAFSYILWLFWPLIRIVEKWSVFLSGISPAERIFESFEWPEEKELTSTEISPSRLGKLGGKITFENVSFAYEDEDWILKDFSLEIPAGKQVGIIGPSGSGKSTLAGLLRRFYEPQKGRILIDDIDIREFDKRALRSAVGFVQQDLFLFSGSIEENINLWDSDSKVSEEQPYSDFLEREAFQKVMEERGLNISSGEKQLLSFLRCLHSKPDIWILDEASANLDQNSEKQIFQLLKQYAANKTIISIAHRVSSLRNADLIVVMHHGKILESGTHQELLKKDGFYAKLYKAQT